MATGRRAEFTFQGEPDESLEDVVEVQAIQEVTGLEVTVAINRAVTAARAECGRENCSGTANVTTGMKVVGNESGPVAGMPDVEVTAPELKVELSCADDGCSSFYTFASHLESLGEACVDAAKAAESEVSVIIEAANTEAKAILSPAQAQARAILAPAQLQAEAILAPAQQRHDELVAQGKERATAERQGMYAQILSDIGFQQIEE